MGVLGNSYSFSYFWADTPDGLSDMEVEKWVIASLQRQRFRPEVHGLSRRSGWVSLYEPFTGELDAESVSLGEFMVFAMRIDERKVPSSLVKQHLALEEQRYMEEKGVRRVPGSVRKKLKEQVEFRLLEKALPVPGIFDVAWDIKEGVVYLFSCSQKVIGEFQALFKATFEFMPVPVVPYTLASKISGNDVVTGLSAELFV